MALQLKDDKKSTGATGLEDRQLTDNPWDNPKNMDLDEPYSTTKSIKSTYVPEKKKNHIMDGIMKIIVFLIVGGLLIILGKAIVSKLMPEGTDVTKILSKPEMELEKDLGITFTDNTTWARNMIQYSGGEMTIRSNEDIGVVYIDNKRVGVHIESNKYTMYGIQVGMGEKKVYDTLSSTYQFDNFMTLVDNDGKKGTTTYYYYRARKNDCIAIVIKNNTNRVDSVTYYNNYKLIIKEADTF
ncbi:MAG: hypothetical protein ACI4GW_04995 [Lachnospiraceae bacterium]